MIHLFITYDTCPAVQYLSVPQSKKTENIFLNLRGNFLAIILVPLLPPNIPLTKFIFKVILTLTSNVLPVTNRTGFMSLLG